MIIFHKLYPSGIFLILISCSHANLPQPNKCRHGGSIRAAYYPSWKQGKLPPPSINTAFFTHIFYAFLNPNNATFKFDVNPKTEAPLLKEFTSTLHRKNPPVKTLFSIGGGDEGSRLFSRMASKKSSRAAFIKSTIQVAKKYGFDGCDLDDEFPQTARDMENFATLLEEWREAVGQDFLITAAVYYSADTFLSGAERAYPVDSIKKSLDWVNVMNYDYHGGWEKDFTGAHAALYDPNTNLSTNFGIGRWIRVGVPTCMLVMGMPMYGRTWTLEDARLNGVGAPAVGVGPGEDGAMTYVEVVKFNEKHKATVVFDSDTVSMYSVAGKSWIGYDDPRSVAVKVSYGKALDLGGYMF